MRATPLCVRWDVCSDALECERVSGKTFFLNFIEIISSQEQFWKRKWSFFYDNKEKCGEISHYEWNCYFDEFLWRFLMGKLLHLKLLLKNSYFKLLKWNLLVKIILSKIKQCIKILYFIFYLRTRKMIGNHVPKKSSNKISRVLSVWYLHEL